MGIIQIFSLCGQKDMEDPVHTSLNKCLGQGLLNDGRILMGKRCPKSNQPFLGYQLASTRNLASANRMVIYDFGNLLDNFFSMGFLSLIRKFCNEIRTNDSSICYLGTKISLLSFFQVANFTSGFTILMVHTGAERKSNHP